MIIKLISWLGFLATLTGLFYSMKQEGSQFLWWQTVLIVITVIAFIYFMVNDFLSCKGKRLKNRSDIQEYMHSWLSHDSKATIFTNDMTWAESDKKIQRLLLEKSKKGELTIVMPNITQFAANCSDQGAKVVTYDGLDYTPSSRFTIVNDGRMDACVAVGRSENGVHTIEEYRIGSHAVFAIANDLVQIIKKIGKVRNNAS